MSEFRKEVTGSKGRYVVEKDGAEAMITWSIASPKLIIVDHTEVPDAFRGQGLGLKLAQRVVADARAEGFRIVPLCPFFKAQFLRHPEWGDVVQAK